MYSNEVIDLHGYIHSIDNIVIDYFLVCSYKTVTDRLMDVLRPHGFDEEGHCKLEVLPSYRYEYYRNLVWYEGFTFSLGKYTNYDRLTKTWTELDIMRFKVNPNKHEGTPIMDDVVKFLTEYCKDGYLVRYDYAVDIRCPLSDVIVLGSRKEKGLYKGTRYLGQRHKHGYCKIYDKQKEQCLDHELTRIEYTFCGDNIPVVDDILIRAPVDVQNGREPLPAQAKLYLDMLQEIEALGGDIESYLQRINFRTRKKLEPYLYTGIRLQLEDQILNKLMDKINSRFIISDDNERVNMVNDISEEFMVIDGTDLPLPVGW